jgi:ABC-type spermidine/putrescine transport system permease subunit I
MCCCPTWCCRSTARSVRSIPPFPRAAAGLGASSFAIFRRIYLPLTLNGIFAGSVLVFVLSLGFFITPALLGGGRVMMIAVLIEQQVREALNWPFAAALSAVLLVFTSPSMRWPSASPGRTRRRAMSRRRGRRLLRAYLRGVIYSS